MKKEQWLEKATRFELDDCTIEARQQIDGSKKWVIKTGNYLLGKGGEFIYELSPSSRTEEFVANTRFGSPDECYEFWLENRRK